MAETQEQTNLLARRFAAFMDETLPTLPGDAAREKFLLNHLRNWERRYNWFVGRIDDDDFDPGDLTAFDFANTISEITVRLSRLEGARS